MFHRASDVGRFFGTTYAMENDRRHGTWNDMGCHRPGSLKTMSRKLA
jgi:hypothetical protein